MCVCKFCGSTNNKNTLNTYSTVKITSETETDTDLSEMDSNINDSINVNMISDTLRLKRRPIKKKKIIRCCLLFKPRFGISLFCVWHICIAIFYAMWILRKELINSNVFATEYILIVILWLTCISRILISFTGTVILSRLEYAVIEYVPLIQLYSYLIVIIPITLDIFYILLMCYYIEILNNILQLYGILMFSFIIILDLMISCFTPAFLKKFMLLTYNIHIFC